MMKMNKTKKVVTNVLVASAVVNLLVNAVIMSSFHLVSSLVYVALAFLIGALVTFNKGDYKKYFVLGLALSASYNVLFMAAGFFNMALLSLLFSAVQQGLITMIIYEFIGGKL